MTSQTQALFDAAMA